jgi:aminobenzoyl-glutamate utilization protein B
MRHGTSGGSICTRQRSHYVVVDGGDQPNVVPIALAMDENIQAVGLPDWSEDDQSFAKALQRLMGSDQTGLATELDGIREPRELPVSGGSADIGDVSWAVLTVTLRYPSNVDGMTAHHWSSAMAMATPIAATMLDLLQNEELVVDAHTYFREEQLKDTRCEPFIGPEDPPAVEKNRETMAEFKDRLGSFYYDASRLDTYLEQLGVDYPQLEKP